jgi:CheY-like chemotaxis protein
MKSIHILFVEDDLLNQFLIKETIKDSLITYEIISNGNQALERIKIKEFDIVFLDINIPGMNGYDLAQKIRANKNPTIQNLPLIAMSASTIDRGKLKDSGINDFIDKPFTEEELKSKISLHLNNKDASNTSTIKKGKIDQDYLSKLSKGNEDFLKDMMCMFIKQKEEAYQNFDQGLKDKDFAKIELTAHNLKSSASLLGVDYIYDLVSSIEKLAGEKTKLDSLNSLIDEVKEQLDHSIQKIGNAYNL